MKKRIAITSLSRLCGVILGIMLIYTIFVFSVTSVAVNGEFWIAQNDRYGHRESLKLVSNDDYNALFHSYTEMLSGEASPEKTDVFVTLQGVPADYDDTFRQMGSVHPGTSAMCFEKSLSFDEKFFYTLTQLENSKHGLSDRAISERLKDKMYIKLTVPFADKSFAGVNISDITVTDNSGTALDTSLKLISVDNSGARKTEEVEKAESILFKPLSRSTELRIYLASAGDISRVNISFSVAAEEGSAAVKAEYTYEDRLSCEEVAKRVGPEAKLTTAAERLQLINAGRFNKTVRGFIILALAIGICAVVIAVKRQNKEAFFGIGVYALITSAVLCAVINLLVNIVPVQWGFNCFFAFSENSTSAILMGEGFMYDLAHGSVRFFDFLMLFPIAVGYVFIKISKPKNYDPNEDYMYQ